MKVFWILESGLFIFFYKLQKKNVEIKSQKVAIIELCCTRKGHRLELLGGECVEICRASKVIPSLILVRIRLGDAVRNVMRNLAMGAPRTLRKKIEK